jgi:hypothetical protein
MSFSNSIRNLMVKWKELIKLYKRTCDIMSRLIGVLCCHVQSFPIMQRTTSPSIRARSKLNFGYNQRTLVGKVVEVVHPGSAAFVERLQYALSLTCKCLNAAQQRRKAFADARHVEKSTKWVIDKVLLSSKYLNLKHSKTPNCKLLSKWTKWIGPF